MSTRIFHDRHAIRMIHRIGDDLGRLRENLTDLVQHAAHHSLPEGARELAAAARDSLVERGERLKELAAHHDDDAVTDGVVKIAGAALAVGLVATVSFFVYRALSD